MASFMFQHPNAEANIQSAQDHSNLDYHELISSVPSIDNRMAKESEEKDMKYGERFEEKEIGLESTQSSQECDSEEAISWYRRFFEKYNSFFIYVSGSS
jgi:hypothetical protein